MSSPLALFACQHDMLPGSNSKEVLVEAIADGSTLTNYSSPMAGEDAPASRITLVDNGDLSDGSKGWLYRGVQLHHARDEGRLKPGSVLVKDRRESWHGPVVRLPLLETRKAYRASIWIKPVETDLTTRARLMLTRVADGGLNSFTLAEIQARPNQWQKLEGEFVGVTVRADEVTFLSLDVDDTKIQYFVDDLVVASADLTEELQATISIATPVELPLVRNGDVEDGLDYWGHHGGVISRSSVHAQSGSYSLLISGRNQSWNGPTMIINSLKDDVRYRFSIYGRIADGEPTSKLQLTMKRVTDGQSSFVPLAQVQGVNNEWRELNGVFASPNISRSETVTIYVEAADPTVSFFVDNITVQEIP